MIDCAAETGAYLMEAMWTRFIPAIRALKTRIEAGEIGELRMFQAELGFAVEEMYARSGIDPCQTCPPRRGDSSTPAVLTMQPSSARLPYNTARPPSCE